MIPPLLRFLIAITISYFLASHGRKRKSLSVSGSYAALLVGFLMLSARTYLFGITLLFFYLTGSRATKKGKERKMKLEDGHAEAGNRNATQVFCNSATALAACVVWTALFDVFPEFVYNIGDVLIPVPDTWKAQGMLYESSEWCALSSTVGDGWSRWLALVTIGHFACCLGDTLASELGILSSTPPMLITTFKRVPPGTNGGVSPFGLLVSAIGGTLIGAVVAITLLLESSACRSDTFGVVMTSLVVGTASGLFGSLIDSLMGATIQCTKYSETKKLILTDESVDSASSEPDVKRISGFDLLSNNQVNLVSSVLTAILAAKFGYGLFL